MKFLEAMLALSDRKSENAKASRPDGPVFTVDHLGQITMHNDCLYLGDILDLADWTVEELGDDAVEGDDGEEWALTEAGWKRIEERADGVQFLRDDGRTSKATDWSRLGEELRVEFEGGHHA